jgi:hypothetical protein
LCPPETYAMARGCEGLAAMVEPVATDRPGGTDPAPFFDLIATTRVVY